MTDHKQEHDHHHEEHPHLGHVVPFPILVAIWGALLVLTYITVAVSWVDLGNLNLIVAMAIATVKATLVVLYFMHMRWETPLNALVFISSLAFVALFIVIVMIDSSEYQPQVIEDYAPRIEQEQE